MTPSESGLLRDLELEEVPCPGCRSQNVAESFLARAYASAKPWLRFRYCWCGDCGALYASPRVRANDMWRFYPSTYHAVRSEAEKIGKGLHLLGTVLQMGLRDPHVVLDWGSGGGEFLEVLRMLGKLAYGYDPLSQRRPLPEAGERDLKSVTSLLPNVRTVTLLDVLEHVHDPEALFRFFFRHSPAEVYVLVPRGDGAEVRRFRGQAYVVQAPNHLFLPTPRSLALLAARAGYDVRLCPQPTTEFWELDWRLRLGGRVFAAQGRESLRDRAVRRLAQSVVRMTQPQRRGYSAHLAAVLRPLAPEGVAATAEADGERE